MKLENQVCSLEQAKRLKELGVIQPDCLGYSALCFWCKPYPAPDNANWDLALSQNPGKVQNEFYAAFTVAELGVMLPSRLDLNGGEAALQSKSCYQNDWIIGYYSTCQYLSPNEDGWVFKQHETGEAEARAALLIRLLESGEITAAEVNARLAAA